MRYFKEINEDNEIVMLLTHGDKVVIKNPNIVEVTEKEYSTLLAEITVNVKENEPSEDDEVSGEEFLNMVEGVL